jgi:hypothetical protein
VGLWTVFMVSPSKLLSLLVVFDLRNRKVRSKAEKQWRQNSLRFRPFLMEIVPHMRLPTK